MSLRPYQREAVDAIINNIDTHCYVSLPTGSGKSHVLAELAKWALQYPETRVLIVTHTRELVEQDYEKVVTAMPNADVSIYCAGLREKRIGIVTVASIQSIYTIRNKLPTLDIIIVDEVHRVDTNRAGQYRSLFECQPEARIVGLTATPYRMRGGLLHEGDEAIFDKLVYEAKTSDLIEQGYLSPIRAKATSEHANIDGLHIRAGEFRADEMVAELDRDELTKAAVKDILRHASGRKSIMVFCAGVEHCKHVVDAFKNASSLSVAGLTGENHIHERDQIINGFKAGTINILCNVGILTTGFNHPGVDCIALLRATASPGLYVQCVGRGLRMADGKTDCLLLDYGEHVKRFGPIDEITAERANSGEAAAPTKTCPDCETIINAGFKVCPHCSYAFPVNETELIKHEARASELDPIRRTVKVEKYGVKEVKYRRHAPPNKPPMMMAEYQCGMLTYFKKPICVEHGNGARHFAEQWFARHGAIAPKTVDEAIKIAQDLPKPKTITVKLGGKWPEIVNYGF